MSINLARPELISEEAVPLVRDPTRTESEKIQSVLLSIGTKEIVIPPYQRDTDQWDSRKESLFIESILNNLTIPAFFFADADSNYEVVDGQQRLSTLRRFKDDEFALSEDEDVEYLTPQAVRYRGKKFSELSEDLQRGFNSYPLTILHLPKGLTLSTKLEIFRRINEGGTALTAQDIRLSYYSESPSVTFIRLAGIYRESEAVKEMLAKAEEKGVHNPWHYKADAADYWRDFWNGKDKAKGQTPSEMFLWYLVQRNRGSLSQFLSTSSMLSHLKLGFRGTTEEALNIYCAQLHYDDQQGSLPIFPSMKDGLQDAFNDFADWLSMLLNQFSGMTVDKYKQMALFIGAATELKLDPCSMKEDVLSAVSEFIRTPRKSGERWLASEGGYPEPRGRWTGAKGQEVQCERVVTLLSKIIETVN
jgi:hypothetical protein